VEFGQVGAGEQHDPEFMFVAGFLIVLRQTLADFSGSVADDGIFVGVVIGVAPEDLAADHSLLQCVEVALGCSRDNMPKQRLAPATVSERAAGENPFQLSQDLGGREIWVCRFRMLS
jgi:hypothetical protein